MNQYPFWRYAVLIVVLAVGAIYALPNIYPQEPALQISERRGGVIDESIETLVATTLSKKNLKANSVKTSDKQIVAVSYTHLTLPTT